MAGLFSRNAFGNTKFRDACRPLQVEGIPASPGVFHRFMDGDPFRLVFGEQVSVRLRVSGHHDGPGRIGLA